MRTHRGRILDEIGRNRYVICTKCVFYTADRIKYPTERQSVGANVGHHFRAR